MVQNRLIINQLFGKLKMKNFSVWSRSRLEPELTQVGRSRSRLRDLGHLEPEPPKKSGSSATLLCVRHTSFFLQCFRREQSLKGFYILYLRTFRNLMFVLSEIFFNSFLCQVNSIVISLCPVGLSARRRRRIPIGYQCRRTALIGCQCRRQTLIGCQSVPSQSRLVALQY